MKIIIQRPMALENNRHSFHVSTCLLLVAVFAASSLLLAGTVLSQTAPLSHSPLPPASSARLGVILPLSGRYAAFGEQALKGILLAADTFGTTFELNKGLSLEIIVKDTR